MTKEMRKRFEEAADKYIGHPREIDEGLDIYICRKAYKEGAEYGYKEAIAQAKEWMKDYFPEELDGKGFEFIKLETILADFESDMNKLWEDEK